MSAVSLSSDVEVELSVVVTSRKITLLLCFQRCLDKAQIAWKQVYGVLLVQRLREFYENKNTKLRLLFQLLLLDLLFRAAR